VGAVAMADCSRPRAGYAAMGCDGGLSRQARLRRRIARGVRAGIELGADCSVGRLGRGRALRRVEGCHAQRGGGGNLH
jgi:hypothetical protein